MLEKLSDLSSLRAPGTFGTHNTAMIWMIVVSTLMYVGPSLVILFYQLYHDRNRSGVRQEILDATPIAQDLRKAA